jgi:hypothetical protein
MNRGQTLFFKKKSFLVKMFRTSVAHVAAGRVTRLGEFLFPLGNCILWAVLRKLQKFHKFSAYYFKLLKLGIILTNMGWATFWEIFSQAHQVTLAAGWFVGHK